MKTICILIAALGLDMNNSRAALLRAQSFHLLFEAPALYLEVVPFFFENEACAPTEFIAKKGNSLQEIQENITETGNKHQGTKKETKKSKENVGIT